MSSKCTLFLPILAAPHDDTLLFLFQLLLRAVFLRLDGIEHLFLLLLGNTCGNSLLLALPIVFAILLWIAVRLLRILLLVGLLTVGRIVLLRIRLILFVLSFLTLLVLILLILTAAPIVLLVVQQTFRIGVIILGLHVRRIETQGLFVAFERFLVLLLPELRIAKIEKCFGTFRLGAERIGCRLPQGLLCLLYTSPSPRDPKTSRMPSSA